MLSNDFNLSYEEFLKQYVISPEYEMTISFSFRDKTYQFEYLNVPRNQNGTIAYDLITYNGVWEKEIK
ncbi:MAG: hypothetical protein HUJ68_00830, partial [Clostridia bacterium]|nr:hypothetical protein [Clostridia bacterium]